MAEPREVMRRFCEAIGCRVYKAIKGVSGKPAEDELRLYCSETCKAYKFNRWINLAGLKIKKKSPSEVYRNRKK